MSLHNYLKTIGKKESTSQESPFGLKNLRSSRSATTLLKITINRGLFLLLCASVRTRDGNCGFKVWFGECVGTDRKLIERQRTERNSVWNKRKRETEKAPNSGLRMGESCISWKLMMTFRCKPTQHGDERVRGSRASPSTSIIQLRFVRKEKELGWPVTLFSGQRTCWFLILRNFSRCAMLLELYPAS